MLPRVSPTASSTGTGHSLPASAAGEASVAVAALVHNQRQRPVMIPPNVLMVK